MKRYQIFYRGHIFWPIFWIFFFFPLTIVLFFKNARVKIGEKTYFLAYNGSYPWLFFWTIFLLPVALILILVKGIFIVEKEGA